ncbi:hypothetical protein PMAYCL1PPCAC_05010, partial [Pristionchus mayeri]
EKEDIITDVLRHTCVVCQNNCKESEMHPFSSNEKKRHIWLYACLDCGEQFDWKADAKLHLIYNPEHRALRKPNNSNIPLQELIAEQPIDKLPYKQSVMYPYCGKFFHSNGARNSHSLLVYKKQEVLSGAE